MALQAVVVVAAVVVVVAGAEAAATMKTATMKTAAVEIGSKTRREMNWLNFSLQSSPRHRSGRRRTHSSLSRRGSVGGMSSKPLSSTNLTIRAQRLAMIALRGSRLALQLSLTSKRRRRHGQHCKAAEVEAQAGQGRKQQQQEEQQAHQWKQHQQQRLLLNPLVRRLLLLLLNLLVLQEGEGGKK